MQNASFFFYFLFSTILNKNIKNCVKFLLKEFEKNFYSFKIFDSLLFIDKKKGEQKMQKMKVAIVDDTKQMKKLIQTNFFNSDEFEVLEINDGKNATNEITEFAPQVVVLDLVLPNKDGFSVLEETKSLMPQTKVIVCSALTNEHFIHKALSLGADNFLSKPISFDALRKAIIESSQEAQSNITSFSTQKAYVNERKKIDEKISNIFITVGIPAHIKGYQFLREAIKMTISTPEIINSITKQLYPNIAKRFSTSPSKVERAIRHAIAVAWNRGKIENINSVFGLPVYDSNDKPTNGEFIALVADKMLVESA